MDPILYFFLDILMSSTYIDNNNPEFQRTNRHCQFGIFRHPCFNKTSWHYRSDNSPANGWSYRFRSRGSTGSSILDHEFRHLCLGRRIHTSAHYDLGIFSNLEVSSSVIWVYADTASGARPSQSEKFAITSMIFVAVICDADDLTLWKQHKRLRHLLQCYHGVPHVLCTCEVSIATQQFPSDMFSSLKQSGLFFCVFVLPGWPSFLLTIPHGLIDTFIPISFFLSTIHLLRSHILTPVSWNLIEWENTLVLETLSRSRWQKHFLLESNIVGVVSAADLRLLLLDFWCGICTETFSDTLSS